MKNVTLPTILWLFIVLVPAVAYPQAFGEYGRVVSGLPQGVSPTAPGSAPPGGSGAGGESGASGKALPIRLVVAVKEAGLYPKQDDESELVARLTQGEALVPMVKSSGGNDWYMVRTQQGMVGWVRSTEVREEKGKK